MQSKATTKELIARSLVRLAATKSLDKITIQEIAADCGLTKTTFYNHFKDKYDLIVWAYAEPVRKITGRLGSGDCSVDDAILDIVRYFDENRKFILNALQNTSGQNYFLHHVAQIHYAVLREFVTRDHGSGAGRPSPKLEVLMKLYAYGTVQMICEWLLDGTPIPAKEFTAFLEAGIPEELKPLLYPAKVDDLPKS